MKRSWFRIHLSTAIALMFVAGGLIGANLYKSEFSVPVNYFGRHKAPQYYMQGFPYPFHVERIADALLDPHLSDDYVHINGATTNALVDLAIALGILAGTTVVLEFFIRRREKART